MTGGGVTSPGIPGQGVVVAEGIAQELTIAQTAMRRSPVPSKSSELIRNSAPPLSLSKTPSVAAAGWIEYAVFPATESGAGKKTRFAAGAPAARSALSIAYICAPFPFGS